MNVKTVLQYLLSATLMLALCMPAVRAQRTNAQPHVRIEISPDKDNWTYRAGHDATFTIRVMRNNVPLKNAVVSYEIGPEKMTPVKTGEVNTGKGEVKLKGGTLTAPGFMTCKCTVKLADATYTNYVNVGFDPENIKPTTTLPADFTEFWETCLAECRRIDMEPFVTHLVEESTPAYNMYHVRLQHYRKGSYLYGKLCVPTKPGRYPAVLRVPGAGVKKNAPETTLAAMGLITFSIGIHGIPQTWDDKQYADLGKGVLRDYAFYHLDSKEDYYYRRVYAGCIRALDFLCSLPEYDGQNLGVIGGSQGGALAMVTAGLDKRIKALVAFYPALCDLTGYLHGRAGGWPAMFAPQNERLNNTPQKIETSRYYDVVNFARFISAPGFYSWGYNDPTCPPTSFYAAYNVVQAPRRLLVMHDSGHWRYPEQDVTNEWLRDILTH